MITASSDPTKLLPRVANALSAGVDLIQLRSVPATPRMLERLVLRVIEAFPFARSRVLVNDRLDIALATGAGGVHLRSDSMATSRAKELAPPDFLIGRSVHDVGEAVRAGRDGADFVLFGPIFPTASKPGHPGVGLGALREVVAAAEVDVLALGGVTPRRVAELMRAGASGVAGISAFETKAGCAALVAAAHGFRAGSAS